MVRELAERVLRGRRAIALAKRRGIDTTAWQQHLDMLLDEAGREPSHPGEVEPWMLWEWRRISIPQWRQILSESIGSGDRRREKYARWMLREILLDPEYQEAE